MSERADPAGFSEVITSPPTDLTPSTSDVTRGVTSTEHAHEANQVLDGHSSGLVRVYRNSSERQRNITRFLEEGRLHVSDTTTTDLDIRRCGLEPYRIGRRFT